MPLTTQVDYLNSTVDDFGEAPGRFKQLVDAWYAGDIARLDTLFSGEFRERYPELYRTLIVKRDEAFVRLMEQVLKGNGTAFVAIGAGHLVGVDGVPAMLTKLGYVVERQ